MKNKYPRYFLVEPNPLLCETITMIYSFVREKGGRLFYKFINNHFLDDAQWKKFGGFYCFRSDVYHQFYTEKAADDFVKDGRWREIKGEEIALLL